MLPWALLALATLAASVDSQCRSIYEPLSKQTRRLEFSGARFWHEIDDMCQKQFPVGFVMLERDFLGLSEADRALCRGQSVPLGLHKTELDPVVWSTSQFLEYEEEVNSTYLAHRRKATTQNATAQVGSLDPSTSQWHLAANDTTFACALCQRAWVDGLYKVRGKVPERPEPLTYAFTFRLVKTGSDDVPVDDALRIAVANLRSSVDEAYPDGIRVEFEKLASGLGGGISLRVRSSAWYRMADKVVRALNGSYAVESWWDADYCPGKRLDGVDWEKTVRGYVREVKLPEFHVATKQCSTRMRGDGDLDAVWDKEVLYWIDRRELCKAQRAKNLGRQL